MSRWRKTQLGNNKFVCKPKSEHKTTAPNIGIIKRNNSHCNILIAIRTRIAVPRILAMQTSPFMGNFAGARAHQHACVEHNQDKNERDLLMSMFGGPTKNPSELFILKTHVGLPYAPARSTVNLATAFG